MSDSDSHETKVVLYRHLSAKDEETLMRDYPHLEDCRKIAQELLPYTVVNNTGFTKHDYDHSVRVIKNSNRILDMLHDDEMLDHDECALLYMAAWLHDVGMMFCSRGDESIGNYTHGEISSLFISAYMTKQNGFGHLDADTADLLGMVICSHNMTCSDPNKDNQSYDAFRDIPEMKVVQGHTYRCRLISAVLCVADLLDFGSERFSPIVFGVLTDMSLHDEMIKKVGGNLVPYLSDSSKEHWRSCSSSQISIRSEQNSIFIEYNGDFEKKKRWLDYYFGIMKINPVVILNGTVV